MHTHDSNLYRGVHFWYSGVHFLAEFVYNKCYQLKDILRLSLLHFIDKKENKV